MGVRVGCSLHVQQEKNYDADDNNKMFVMMIYVAYHIIIKVNFF